MTTIHHVGIVGEGKMGSNIFNYLIGFGFRITWVSSVHADKSKIERAFSKKTIRGADAGIFSAEQAEFIVKNSMITSDISALDSCDLILEAIPEDIFQKQRLFIELDNVIPASCILASNSSSISPERLIPSESRKDKTVGVHFFYPVSLKNIVEFNVLQCTSTKTIESLEYFLKKINRRVLLLHEQGAFMLNKIFLEVQNEGFNLVEEGDCSFQTVDEIAKSTSFPSGIFDFCDAVGIDTMLASVLQYAESHPGKSRYERFINKLQQLVHEGKLGQKSGQGFYNYSSDNLGISFPPDRDDNLKNKIISRLEQAFRNAVDHYSSITGYSPGQINDAMKEYFGTAD